MIYVDYSKTKAAVNKLLSVASSYGQLSTSANRVTTLIPSYWKGSSATAFSNEINRWINENKAIQNELVSLARDIRRVADELEETEARISSGFGGGG